jgi:plasmid maintenance system antidote protein VapI
VSPGGDSKETMEALGIDFPLFVIKMGISAEGAKNLLDGKAPLTEAIARRLELTLNLDAQFWLNREANYRGKLKQLNT